METCASSRPGDSESEKPSSTVEALENQGLEASQNGPPGSCASVECVGLNQPVGDHLFAAVIPFFDGEAKAHMVFPCTIDL